MNSQLFIIKTTKYLKIEGGKLMDTNEKRICSICRDIKSYRDFYHKGVHHTKCSTCRNDIKAKRMVNRIGYLEKAKQLD